MPESGPVTRDAILRTLTTVLEPLPWVDAVWEGGAAAFGRLDAWSDVDLYVVVADDKVAETFQAIEAALTDLSPVRRKYEPAWPPESGTAQAFYRLEGANDFLLLDLAIFKRSARDRYLEPELHGRALFAFNKGNAVTVPPLDRDAFTAKLLERRERLKLRVELFGPFVTKELLRKNGLGALEAYERIVLDALVQVLWMRHHPVHYAFGVRYAKHELPPEIVHRLERLSFVGGPEELEGKSREAVAWFQETVNQVDEAQVRSRISSG